MCSNVEATRRLFVVLLVSVHAGRLQGEVLGELSAMEAMNTPEG